MKFQFLSFKGEAPPKTPISPDASTPAGARGRPYQERWSVERAVTDAFERDLWVYKCAHQIAINESRLPILLTSDKTDDNRDYDDPVLALLNERANPLETGQQFRYRLGLQLLLSRKGVFVELIRDRKGGDVTRLDLLPPDLTRPIPAESSDDYVEGFEVTVRGGQKGWVVYDLPPERVLWIKRPHPLDPYTGNTPMEAAGLSIDTDFYTRMYNYNFVKRDGRPQTILGYKGDMNAADAKELERRYNGPGYAGSAPVLSVVDNVEQLMKIDLVNSPRDMQYRDLRAGTKEEILMAFGVPESQLGNASGRTFDNADAEAVFFWSITMLDHNATLLDPFNSLRDNIADGLHFEHDIEKVEPLQRVKRAQRDQDRSDIGTGGLTPNEYRQKWGEDPIEEPGAEALYMPSGLTPITGEAAKQAAEQAAAAAAPPAAPPGTPGLAPEEQAAAQDALQQVDAQLAATKPTSNGAGTGAPKGSGVTASQNLQEGQKILLPGAEDAGWHRVRKVTRRRAGGKSLIALTVSGPLTVDGRRETLFYPDDVAFKFSEDQARDDHGRWTSGGGGDGGGLPRSWSPKEMSDAFDRSVVPLHMGQAKIATLHDVLDRMRSGQPVSISNQDVHTFVDVLAARVKAGEDFDLNTVSVGGQTIFRGTVGPGGPEGPVRDEMPQIPNEWKGEFFKELADKGVTAQDMEVPAAGLKPTQREIGAAKTVGMMDKINSGELDLNAERVLISNDGYLLDGHHRWSAALTKDYADDGQPGDIMLPVTVINQSIDQLLVEANDFVDRHGLPRLGFGESFPKGGPWLFFRYPHYSVKEMRDAERMRVKDYDESQHPRADDGKWTIGSGGDSGRDDHGNGHAKDSTRDERTVGSLTKKGGMVVSGGDVVKIGDKVTCKYRSPITGEVVSSGEGKVKEIEGQGLGVKLERTGKTVVFAPEDVSEGHVDLEGASKGVVNYLVDNDKQLASDQAVFRAFGFKGAMPPFATKAPEFKYREDQLRDHGRFATEAGGGTEDEGPHAVGVSSDPTSQSLHTLTGPRQPGESAEAYNERLYANGQERYPPAPNVDREADEYRAEHGLPDPLVTNWNGLEADWDRAQAVGDAFAAAQSNPDDPAVRAAYGELVDQTMDQWHALTDPIEDGGQGVKVDFVSPEEIRDKYGDKEGLNPYPTAQAQRDDIANGHLAIASISDYPGAYHPILSNERGGEYDIFRAVHDAFGHAAIGADFTRHGEFQAWVHHTSMYSGDAKLAASTELTGENSFLITHQEPAIHKAALLDPAVLELDEAQQLVLSGAKAMLAHMDSTRGGEAEIFEKYGVVKMRDALMGAIARGLVK